MSGSIGYCDGCRIIIISHPSSFQVRISLDSFLDRTQEETVVFLLSRSHRSNDTAAVKHPKTSTLSDLFLHMDPVAPSIPPSYLVLHKLKQWDDCRTSAFNTSASNNQNTDLVHKQLIGLLRSLRYSVPPFHHDPTYDLNLHNESAPRVDRFLATHNIYGKEWQQMGFRRGPKPKVSAWSHVGTINAVSGGAVQSSEGPARQRPRYRDFGVISAASEAVRPGEGPARSKEKSMRPRWKDLSAMQIRSLAAQTTVAILAELGLPCAIFGSMACKLYGNQRLPNVRSFLVPKAHTHHL